MKTLIISAAALAAGLLVSGPVLAQASADSPKSKILAAEKQRTDGNDPTTVGPGSSAFKQRTDGEAPTAVGPGSGAYKQHTQGLPPGTKPPAYGSEWAKKHQ